MAESLNGHPSKILLSIAKLATQVVASDYDPNDYDDDDISDSPPQSDSFPSADAAGQSPESATSLQQHWKLCHGIRNGEVKKRAQVRQACINCRKSHSACDNARPCKRCIAQGVVDQCTDIPRFRKRKQSDTCTSGKVIYAKEVGSPVPEERGRKRSNQKSSSGKTHFKEEKVRGSSMSNLRFTNSDPGPSELRLSLDGMSKSRRENSGEYSSPHSPMIMTRRSAAASQLAKEGGGQFRASQDWKASFDYTTPAGFGGGGGSSGSSSTCSGSKSSNSSNGTYGTFPKEPPVVAEARQLLTDASSRAMQAIEYTGASSNTHSEENKEQISQIIMQLQHYRNLNHNMETMMAAVLEELQQTRDEVESLKEEVVTHNTSMQEEIAENKNVIVSTFYFSPTGKYFNRDTAIVTFDIRTGMLTECNEKFCQLLGYSLSELMSGYHCGLLIPGAQMSLCMEPALGSQQQNISTMRINFLRKDGNEVPVDVNSFYIRDKFGTALMCRIHATAV